MTSDALRDALKRGLDLHKSARLDEALTWYRAALAIDADDAEVNSLLGLALVHTGRGDEGLSYLRRAVELEPEQVPFRFNLVQGLHQAGAHGGALAELGVILAREPSNFFAWELAGDIAREQGDNEGAAAAWERARQADPTATSGEAATTEAPAPTVNEPQEQSKTIVVTGSRIRRPNEFSSPDPIQIINPELGRQEGKIETVELINSSPIAAGSPSISTSWRPARGRRPISI